MEPVFGRVSVTVIALALVTILLTSAPLPPLSLSLTLPFGVPLNVKSLSGFSFSVTFGFLPKSVFVIEVTLTLSTPALSLSASI